MLFYLSGRPPWLFSRFAQAAKWCSNVATRDRSGSVSDGPAVPEFPSHPGPVMSTAEWKFQTCNCRTPEPTFATLSAMTRRQLSTSGSYQVSAIVYTKSKLPTLTRGCFHHIKNFSELKILRLEIKSDFSSRRDCWCYACWPCVNLVWQQ